MSDANDATAPWRVYLYGAGSIAWRHGVAAESLGPDAQLFAADPSEDARRALLARFPRAAAVYEDAEAMLASSPGRERDVVVVAVPPYLHRAATLLAFRSGRHVLCEKPLATSEAEMAEMLAASDASGRLFGDCSSRYLGNGALGRARRLIEAGGIGSVYHARFVSRQPRSRAGIEYQPASTWFLDKDKSGGGVVLDWGVYDVAMFFDVLRPVAATVNRAWLATPRTGADPPAISVETHAGASLTLTLRDGTVVPFDWERASGFHGAAEAALSVDGTAGGLTWEWVPTFDYRDEVDDESEAAGFRLVHSVDVDGKVENREERFAAFGWEDANRRPLLSFVDLIQGRDTAALSRSRLEFNFGVVSAIYKCASEGKPVHVQLK
ncbi:NAD(P)-binding protein [Colletotrichum falcatum]|nr:NAD(P)-binding protein [Colletotrichum falcatum]